MKNHPTQHCGLQSSCYRKRDLDNCNDLNLRSETQTLGQLLPADGQHHQQVDRANSGEQLSPSISYSQCASSPSFTPLASTTDMGHNSNLAPSLSISAPEAEPASVILGKLPLNVSHLSLSSTIVHCSHVPPFRPPSFAVRLSPSFVLSTAPVLSSIHPIDDTISAVQTSPFQGESAQVHRQVLMHPYKPKQLFPKVQMDLMRPVATPKPSVPQLFLPGTSEGDGAAAPSILPFEASTGDRRMAAVASSIIFPSHPYGGVVQGPVTSPPTIDISKPPQKEPRIPVAEPPRKRTRRQAPVEVLPKNQGPIAYPPNIFPSEPRWKHPRLPGIAPPGKRLQRHAPATSPPMIQGTAFPPQITFPPERPSRNSRTPALAPLTIYPSPSRHHGVTGPDASPLSISPSAQPPKKPRIPVAASPRKISWWHALAPIPPMNQGTTSSPPIALPHGPYTRNSRIPAFAPSIKLPSPSYRQGPVASPNIDTSEPPWMNCFLFSGLPASPPSSNATLGSPSGVPGRLEPFGVEVKKRSEKMGGGTIAVVALSSAVAMVICLGAIWLILLKCSKHSMPALAVAPTLTSSVTKRSGGGSILSSSMASSTSLSFASSMATYMGSAKTFTLAELEKATDRFNPQSILGEGGFGRVYRGVLEDGTKVAVKVLTRDDQQGGREFIAEVEMLSRLHHRNLVKLIGICNEGHNRCLVYELIPNGSVESHLHGLDKETAPLDWDARMKIALGAARGLAYLHEDSSPRVIHRDFKASNILLEDDFTPKVSDFGLAKAASEEGSEHISTRVMGTFGYVAPEYAMTGHLLVKSDVYSYGVVLLELLSGRKPVDMSQPPGQENLVTWARPLLTSKEGLETLMDPALGGNLPFDNMAKVAAIASMCVQPEVSHRPFMGEVVQALKLVYNDSDASNGGGSGSCSQGGESFAHDNEVKDGNGPTRCYSIQYVPDSTSFVTIDYDSGPLQTQTLEADRPLSASALLSTSGRFIRQLSGSFRRHSSSGPLRTLRSKPSWYRVWGLTGGSMSEHGLTNHFGSGLDREVHDLWP